MTDYNDIYAQQQRDAETQRVAAAQAAQPQSFGNASGSYAPGIPNVPQVNEPFRSPQYLGPTYEGNTFGGPRAGS